MKPLAVVAELAFVAGCQASGTPGPVASAVSTNSAAASSADATPGSDLDFTVEDATGTSYANNQKNSQALGS